MQSNINLLRKLARTYKWQSLYRRAKNLYGIQLFENTNKQAVYTESLEKQYVINGVAWSPKSDMFVLLCTKRRHTINWNINPLAKQIKYLNFDISCKR